jgi:hypothetical protein
VKVSRNRRWIAAFWGYITLLASISASAYLRLLPRSSGLLALPHADHVLHFLLLGGASFLSHRALGGRWILARCLRAPLGPLLIGAVSITDECLQAFSPARTFDLLDMASNVGGVLLFGAAAEVMIRRAVSQRTTSPLASATPGGRVDPGAP